MSKKLLTLIIIVASNFIANAQWTQNGPEGGSFLIKENNGILYSTNAIGLYTKTSVAVICLLATRQASRRRHELYLGF